VVYTLRLGKPQPLALRATLGAEARTTFWFAGNTYLGRAGHGEALSWLPSLPGHYSLRVVDDSGGADTRDVAVEVLP
jgi:membrane carboxypeptidase/penicillin-binding protein PbpC